MRENRSESPAQTDSEAVLSLEDIPLHSTTLLTVLDENGIIQYESPSITNLYGYEQDDLIGEPVAQYFHPDDRETVVEAFQTIVTRDEHTIEAVEYRHKQADGTYLWVESVGSANPTPEGFYVINSRDISAQKQRERELTASNKRLEQFARYVTHDLRNPLSVAQGYLDLASDESPSAHHETVATALDRMETLIDRLRADAQSDHLTVDCEPVDLERLCETCWQHVATEESTLETDIGKLIQTDPFRLKQLVENLFRNAIEHNEQAVRIRVGELDDGFYIEDNGSGIPDSHQEWVFETGYTTITEGTGYGLGIVSQIVAAHGWDITISESEMGGIRFDITGVQFAAPGSA